MSRLLTEKIFEITSNNNAKIFIASNILPPPDNKHLLLPGRPRMFLGLDGCRKITIDHKGILTTVSLRRGDILFAGSRCGHIPDDEEENEVLCLIADEKYFICNWQKADHSPSGLNTPHYLFQHNYPVNEPAYRTIKLIDEICSKPENEETVRLFAQSALLLTANLLKKTVSTNSKGFNTYMKLQNCVKENCLQPLNRKDVARILHLHPSHVSRLFDEFCEESFSAYTMRLRMESAKTLLEENNFTVKEVAFRCGFKNANYFSKVFKKYFGYSPSQTQ